MGTVIIRYGVYRKINGKNEWRNGQLEVAEELWDEPAHTQIREAIRQDNPGWKVEGYALKEK